MERSGISHDLRHLEVPSGESKTIFEPMVRPMQTVQLSCIKISTVSKWPELSLEPRHVGVTLGASKMISKLMVHLAQNLHLSCTDTNAVSKEKK